MHKIHTQLIAYPAIPFTCGSIICSGLQLLRVLQCTDKECL